MGRTGVASRTSRDVLLKGMRLLFVGVRQEPRIFAVSVGGAILAALLTVGSAFVVGSVVARVVVPSLGRHRIDSGALAVAALVLVALGVLKVVGIVGRRLGGFYLQVRLQATYRRLVTRRYLELPPAWHHRNATGTLLSNASADVDSAWAPTVVFGFALATVVMLV